LLLVHAINHVGCAQMEVKTELPADVQADLISEAGAVAVVVDPAACGDNLTQLLTRTHPLRLFSLGPGGTGEDLLALAGRESPNSGPMTVRKFRSGSSTSWRGALQHSCPDSRGHR
jgi:hypothetical protein